MASDARGSKPMSAELSPGVGRAFASQLPEREALEGYLREYFGHDVRLKEMQPLGGDSGEKGFGYGVPLRLTLEGAPIAAVVLHLPGSKGFGHDSLTDRAREALLPYDTFNSFESHVPALDVGIVSGDGRLRSLGEVQEFFYLTGFAEGRPYFEDLERIASAGLATDRDLYRVDALVDALVRNHARKKDAPELYRRRLRDLFGHHECLPGLLDSYDAYDVSAYTSRAALVALEQRGVLWRHEHKQYTHRLCHVHGDFHPWNVLFDSRDRVTLLDRARGEWGEPADDVACMALNYLFFSLKAEGRLAGGLAQLWERFFEVYLRETEDEELVQLLPPYLVWRALVLASPLWYPSLDVGVRRALFRLIDRLQTTGAFDWRDTGDLLVEDPDA
jgi:hypothetical protein